VTTAFQPNAFQNNAFQIDGGPPPTVVNAGRKYRYRVRLEDGTIIEAKSYIEAQRLKRQYATQLKAPEVVVKKARKTVVPRVERVEIRPKEVYAVPIKDPLIIDLKGDPNALLAKIRLELDDDDEAIQIAMDLL